jgi:hypothetical protein
MIRHKDGGLTLLPGEVHLLTNLLRTLQERQYGLSLFLRDDLADAYRRISGREVALDVTVEPDEDKEPVDHGG